MDRTRRSNFTIPNVLSSLRLASVPVLLWLAWTGRGRAYVIAFGAIYATDLLDGLMARRLKQETQLGATTHAWFGKTSSSTLAIGAVVAMLDWADWPFRIGLILTSLACLEEIDITLTLPVARSNVPTLWHAWRFRGLHQSEVRSAADIETTDFWKPTGLKPPPRSEVNPPVST